MGRSDWRPLRGIDQRRLKPEKRGFAASITVVAIPATRVGPAARSTLRDLEQPDRLIFDLDPGEDAPWEAVIEAARELRDRQPEKLRQDIG
jgi:DNA primase